VKCQFLQKRQLDTPSNCYEWMNDSEYKYCSFSNLNSCCHIDDTKYTCNSDNSMVSCSNDGQTDTSKYTLWPESTDCGQQVYSFNQNSGTTKVSTSNYINSSNPTCSYKFTKEDTSFESIQLTSRDLENTSLGIYLESSSGSQTFVQTLGEEQTLTLTLVSGQALVMKVTFTNTPASFGIIASKLGEPTQDEDIEEETPVEETEEETPTEETEDEAPVEDDTPKGVSVDQNSNSAVTTNVSTSSSDSGSTLAIIIVVRKYLEHNDTL